MSINFAHYFIFPVIPSDMPSTPPLSHRPHTHMHTHTHTVHQGEEVGRGVGKNHVSLTKFNVTRKDFTFKSDHSRCFHVKVHTYANVLQWSNNTRPACITVDIENQLSMKTKFDCLYSWTKNCTHMCKTLTKNEPLRYNWERKEGEE